MTRPLDGTISSPVGRLDVSRLECPTCGRFGCYHVAKLVDQLGAGYRLMY
jgi:hypothetical protein